MRVYQCRGADPASSSDCYGSPGLPGRRRDRATTPAFPAVPAFTYPGQTDPYNATPDGPANWQDNVTRADGTGEVAIQLFTKRESAGLGCDATAPCSIVVVPELRPPAGRDRGPAGRPLGLGAAHRRPAGLPAGRRRLPADRRLAARRGQPGRRACARQLAGADLHPRARTPVDPRLHLDRRAADPWRRRRRHDRRRAGHRPARRRRRRRRAASSTRRCRHRAGGRVPDRRRQRPARSRDLSSTPAWSPSWSPASYRSGGNPAVIEQPGQPLPRPGVPASSTPPSTWPGGAPGNHPLLLGDLSDTTSP